MPLFKNSIKITWNYNNCSCISTEICSVFLFSSEQSIRRATRWKDNITKHPKYKVCSKSSWICIREHYTFTFSLSANYAFFFFEICLLFVRNCWSTQPRALKMVSVVQSTLAKIGQKYSVVILCFKFHHISVLTKHCAPRQSLVRKYWAKYAVTSHWGIVHCSKQLGNEVDCKECCMTKMSCTSKEQYVGRKKNVGTQSE